MTIFRYYEMRAREGCEHDLRAALGELAAQVVPLPGCDGADFYRDPGDPALFVFIERWDSIDAHRLAGAMLGKHAFAPVMAALSGPPSGRYLEPAGGA